MSLPPSPTDERVAAFWPAYVEDPAAAVRALFDELGPVFRVPTPGGGHATFAIGPEWNDLVLAREHRRFRLRGAFRHIAEVAPECLLAKDGEHALRIRALLTPALRKDRVDLYEPIVREATEHALAQWPRDEPFELAQAMRRLTLRTAARAFLDLEATERLAQVIETLAEYVTPGPRAAKEELRPQFLEARAWLHGLVDGLIAERRATAADRGDVLSALVLADELDDEELRDNIWALLFASHDTTAHALAWAVYLLAQRPHDDLELAIKETLRLYPSAPAIPRIAEEDVDLGDYTVPPGETVICHFVLTQRLPELFERPDEFVPERWLDAKPPKGAYVPFGLGPRWCPGMPFALMEMRVVLETLRERVRFTIEPGQRIVAYATAPTMRPKPGIVVRVANLV